MNRFRHRVLRVGAAAAAAGAAAAGYMVFEAQWPVCLQADLHVSGLPAGWKGTTVLHLSDVHAGLFPTNERSLAKIVTWAAPLRPDLVFLTGDMIGDPRRSAHALQLLSRLQPPLGTFAVTGNHEYGLSKGPFARARDVNALWTGAGVTLLRDDCAALPERDGARVVICGGDYLTSGLDLLERRTTPGGSEFPILLIHEPPSSVSPLTDRFPLAFAGHTHGGQIRVPAPSGLRPVNEDDGEFLAGVHAWGQGLLVVTRGVGTSFLPFRLLTRPEATLWRLV